MIQKEDSCAIDMRKVPEYSDNQDCMYRMLKYGYSRSYHLSSKVYLIWLLHGWKHSPKKPWVPKLKDSYFKRYPQKSGLVTTKVHTKYIELNLYSFQKLIMTTY